MANRNHSIPQPVPALNDDVLLRIFAELELVDLSAVTKACRRFNELAQYTFSRIKQRRLTLTQDVLMDPGKVYDILCVFGPFTEHFAHDVMWLFYSPLVWFELKIASLKSMKIDPFRMRLDRIDKFISADRFEQLESLHLFSMNANPPALNFNFRHWFPNLKSLKLVVGMDIVYDEELLPRTLHTLDMDLLLSDNSQENYKILLRLNPDLVNLRLRDHAWRLKPNDILNMLIDFGLHAKLESFELIDDRETFQYDDFMYEFTLLTPRLNMFQRLKTLVFGSRVIMCIVQNVPVLGQLTNLEILKMSMANYVDPEPFLMALATNCPVSLKEFAVPGQIEISEDNWKAFVAAMPNTCKCQKYEDLNLYLVEY